MPLDAERPDEAMNVADFLVTAPHARRYLSEEQLTAMYRDGPQRGFRSRLDMLNAEFGRCAYCGQQGVVEEVEHYLPRCHFPFDGSFNVLPSCAACNRRKGPRTGLGAGMTIHADAVAAYRAYVEQRRTPHLFHRLKFDLLELLAWPTTAATDEEALLKLAAGLSAASESQRSPRPLSRYLATKLEGLTGQRPTIELVPGRQTALYRSLAMPEFDKQERKRQGDLREDEADQHGHRPENRPDHSLTPGFPRTVGDVQAV